MHDRSKKYTGWKILMDTHRKKYMQQALHNVEIDTKKYQKKSWGELFVVGGIYAFLKEFLWNQ